MYSPHPTNAEQAQGRMVFLGGKALNGISLAIFMYVIAGTTAKFGELSRLEKKKPCRDYITVDKTVEKYLKEEL
jgi:hypothetical protein